MANARRGEIEAVIDGRPRVLCLTLGALAELETAFGVDDLVALAERFASGRLSALDLIRILGAGLRGAGEAIPDAEVAFLAVEGGALGAAEAVARLVAATFGGAPVAPAGPAGADPAAAEPPGPFAIPSPGMPP